MCMTELPSINTALNCLGDTNINTATNRLAAPKYKQGQLVDQ